MSQNNRTRNKRWKMYLRFETERVAALTKLFSKTNATPGLTTSEAALQQKLLDSLPKSLHPILHEYGGLCTEEKQYFYRKGFIDCKMFLQSCAENYPERLSSILGVKGSGA